MENIKQKITDIIALFVPETKEMLNQPNIIQESLHKIISDSVQAIHFVSLIESEFEVEIDDEYINYDFFSHIDHIITAIRESNF
jgi:acyl carrier protein